MMDDRELKALADDIKANGLREPIKVTADGVLVEGRNRLAACELAGVEPEFETANGDLGDLIVSANIMRRHMTKGQIAILAVVAELDIELPDSDVALSATSNSRTPRQYDFRKQARKRVENLVSLKMIQEAADIVDWAPDQARLILDNAAGWKDSLAVAAERRRQTTSEDNRRKLMAEDSPELLAQVDDESLTLDEAWGLRESRLREAREKRIRLTGYLVDEVTPLLGKTESGITEMVEQYDPEFARRPVGIAELDEALNRLQLIKREMKRLKKGLN
jgi:ParB-like chromosome segregation protein Spo0J